VHVIGLADPVHVAVPTVVPSTRNVTAPVGFAPVPVQVNVVLSATGPVLPCVTEFGVTVGAVKAADVFCVTIYVAVPEDPAYVALPEYVAVIVYVFGAVVAGSVTAFTQLKV
jgi:hypothetical protein